MAPFVSTISSSFSICLRRLWACLLLLACDPNRCTKSWSSPIFFFALSATAVARWLVFVLGAHEVGVVARVNRDRPKVDVRDVRREIGAGNCSGARYRKVPAVCDD